MYKKHPPLTLGASVFDTSRPGMSTVEPRFFAWCVSRLSWAATSFRARLVASVYAPPPGLRCFGKCCSKSSDGDGNASCHKSGASVGFSALLDCCTSTDAARAEIAGATVARRALHSVAPPRPIVCGRMCDCEAYSAPMAATPARTHTVSVESNMGRGVECLFLLWLKRSVMKKKCGTIRAR